MHRFRPLLLGLLLPLGACTYIDLRGAAPQVTVRGSTQYVPAGPRYDSLPPPEYYVLPTIVKEERQTQHRALYWRGLWCDLDYYYRTYSDGTRSVSMSAAYNCTSAGMLQAPPPPWPGTLRKPIAEPPRQGETAPTA